MKNLYIGKTIDGKIEVGSNKKLWNKHGGFDLCIRDYDMIGKNDFIWKGCYPEFIYSIFNKTVKSLKPGEIKRIKISIEDL